MKAIIKRLLNSVTLLASLSLLLGAIWFNGNEAALLWIVELFFAVTTALIFINYIIFNSFTLWHSENGKLNNHKLIAIFILITLITLSYSSYKIYIAHNEQDAKNLSFQKEVDECSKFANTGNNDEYDVDKLTVCLNKKFNQNKNETHKECIDRVRKENNTDFDWSGVMCK